MRVDGNSYYRAVAYSYLELLVMNRKTQSLKDLVKWINSDKTLYSIHMNDFDRDYRAIVTKHILELIHYLKKMENNSVLYCLVQKMFVLNPDFDHGMIMFFKNIVRNFILNQSESHLNGRKLIDGMFLEKNTDLNDYLDQYLI
jgi:hypothetical protein